MEGASSFSFRAFLVVPPHTLVVLLPSDLKALVVVQGVQNISGQSKILNILFSITTILAPSLTAVLLAFMMEAKIMGDLELINNNNWSPV